MPMPTTFFGDASRVDDPVDGSESRRTANDHQNALSNSLKLQCPNWTGPVTKTDNEINDGAEKSATETVSGSWTFTQTLNLNSEVNFSTAGAVTLRANNATSVAVSVGGASRLDVSALAVTVQGATDFVVGGDTTLQGVNCGPLTASGNVQIGGQFRPQVGSATLVQVNPDPRNIAVYNASGVLQGYIRLWDGV